ncbi:MAG: A/G-specific adenine glycosylase [Candidatus Thioglobus sp.]|uniref:A/G-specific adenine glycosylase n=1 Tax=Candidatus Thioglobus sp. TaxID=2026721 RepID=UPI00261242BD|nr:A/G-specific adenine glycosylase [Candidatus Thioglobus sp.]MDC9726322.1 A/G-specific adenine glycosylase [Candidatus Thioglobus sp.]
MSALSRQLLVWFDQHGRTHLPWQKGNKPKANAYHVWLSEIMLQQTQVATVIGYFNRFIHHFPTLADLANASEDEVLAQWAGLGYYARARNLHKTAQIIVKQYQGIFPKDFDQALALPGIGRSTAGAILALSFNQQHTILDGNVKRVLARVHQVTGHYSQSATLNKLWQLADQHTPRSRTDHYTQAIMDLGATLCTRTKPNCAHCPISDQCRSFKAGTQSQYPYPKPKKQKPSRTVAMLVFVNNHQIHLYKRPSSGIWGGLWSFVECEDTPKAIQQTLLAFDPNATINKHLDSFKHTFTHYHLHIHPVVVNCSTTNHEFYSPQQSTLGVPKPVAKIISHLENGDMPSSR